MDENQGEFNIGKEEAKGDIFNVKGNVYIDKKPSKIEKPPFPFPRSLNNQCPPEPNFVGRTDMLKTINDCYKNPDVRVASLIGWGGAGKSALARKWFDSLNENKIHPDGIFWWGFYRNAYLDRFLDSLLDYLAQGRININELKGTWQNVDKIKEFILEGEYLIILDGLEEMQKDEVCGEEFGCMDHRECSELLKFIADSKGKGLCLITTRYPLTDIKNYEGTAYQNTIVDRLELEDARALFEKVGVCGKPEEIDSVIKEYDGHALSLTLLSNYLVEDFGSDIKKANEIPKFHSDKEAGGKAHRILLWYAKQLTEEQQAFMKIFSLFRRDVSEYDFEGVFRAEMETKINQKLRNIYLFSFKRMVDNLCDRRLISRGHEKSYSTHPLIKNYFESIFEEEDKKLCHKSIYGYIGSYAPERPETLEEMQPLFEQVYHGCKAGLYDEVFEDVYWGKICRKEEYFIYHRLGAWETNLSLAKIFFPEGDLSQMPLVSKKSDQSWLLNEAGLALLAKGQPKEAEDLLIRRINLAIEDKFWLSVYVSYLNLADLQFRTGELDSGLESAKKSLDSSEKADFDQKIVNSKAYLAWILYLIGKNKEADEKFRQAEELEGKVTGYQLYGLGGIFYANFLISINRIDEAFELTNANLEICQRYKAVNEISRCCCCLGAVERIKKNYKDAEDHLQKALELAHKIGVPYLEIEALLEFGRLRLDTGKHKEAIDSCSAALKLCERTGFKFYEPDAELISGKALLALEDFDRALDFANSAYNKAKQMHYRWCEGDSAHLLGEIYSAKGDKDEARKWLNKALACRKEISDPDAGESEMLLESL